MQPLLSASRMTYTGLLLTTLATLMYELLLVRIFSVTMYYHFAFVAISVAMFGMTCGALAVYLFPRFFPSDRVKNRLAAASLGFAVAIIFSLLTHLAIPFRTDPSVGTFWGIALNYFSLSIPFMLSGVVVCLALTKFPADLSTLYAFDLAGAALGCILLVGVLAVADAPSAVVATAALAGIGAVLFARDAGDRRLGKIAVAASVLMAGLAMFNISMGSHGIPPLRLLWVKGNFESPPIYTKWSSFARISVTDGKEFKGLLDQPFGWGMSDAYKGGHKPRQLHMDIDAAAGTVMTEFSGDLSTLDYLTYDVTNFVHHLRHDKRVLVIGVGGGRDILSAMCFRQKSVLGVEINQDIIDAVNKRFGAFTGHLDAVPGVTFVNDEARSYIARSTEQFDIIQASLIDSWAATTAGAFVLAENSLYTTEAWQLFLRRLTPAGVLTFSRWYFPNNPTEIYRLTSLAALSLLSVGTETPRNHILLIGKRPLDGGESSSQSGIGVATMMVFREPLTEADMNAAENIARELRFEILVSPRGCADEIFPKLTSAKDLEQFTRNYPFNIEAPTDDKPFFFNMLRPGDMFNPLYWKGGAARSLGTLAFNTRAVAILGILIIIVLFLTGMCILGPLMLTTEREVLKGAKPLMFFFSAIGFGFMMVEISQMQRLIIFLGHPTYGLSVILFSLLLSSGLGSYATNRIGAPGTFLAPVPVMVALLFVLMAFGLITPYAVRSFEASSTLVRIGVATAILFPIGIFMGAPFPLGMKCALHRAPLATSWLWGINGATSVVASVLAVAISLAWGVSTVFWTGFCCYVLALLAFISAIQADPGRVDEHQSRANSSGTNACRSS